MGCIYKAENIINGKVYIGKTMDALCKRKSKHLSEARNNRGFYFQKSIKKHGADSFKWDILFESKDEEELLIKEIYYISHYDAFKNGYNLTVGGEGTTGSKRTPEQSRKISLATKKQWLNEETKNKLKESVTESWKTRESTAGKNNPAAKSVRCIETGVIFNTGREAASFAKRSYPNVCSAAKGYRKSCGGYTWEYL